MDDGSRCSSSKESGCSGAGAEAGPVGMVSE